MLKTHSLETIDGAFVIYKLSYEHKQYAGRGAPSWHYQEHFYSRQVTAQQVEKLCLELANLYRNTKLERVVVYTRMPMALPPGV